MKNLPCIEQQHSNPARMARALLLLLLWSAAAAIPALAEAAAGGATPAAQGLRAQPGDADQTLRAMRDEMGRSKERLQIPGLEKPFYIEYRLLDVEVKTMVASFGALLQDDTTHNRIMAVDVRVGDYTLDSSNFLGANAFQGFLGTTGTIGLDGDYASLRQDLWLSTDQAYKEALDTLARKRAAIRNLNQAPNIPDFSRVAPVIRLTRSSEPDWSKRDWAAEAKAVSDIFREHPELTTSRVTYYLVHFTYYVMNSEGTQIRKSDGYAAIEAGAQAPAQDGMSVHNFYTAYARQADELPGVDAVKKGLGQMVSELLALRESSPAPDYIGPMLFEAPAAASLVAQVSGPSLTGSRPPLSLLPAFDQMMERMGGRSEWIGRLGGKVLPDSVSLIDDPTIQAFNGKKLMGSYDLDEEGVPGQRVTIVDNGVLRNLLLSRRPGPDFGQSNGHARSSLLGEPKAAMSNLFFVASGNTSSPEELRKKFLDLCREDGREWCVAVKRLDNPMLAALPQEDASDLFASLASGGASSGDRLPLLVYRVYVSDGREELIRGGRLTRLTLRSLRDRNLVGIGNDPYVDNFFLNPSIGFSGTALAPFGSAQGGIPASVVAPSLLLEEAEVIGARGQPRRPPLVSAPPLK